MIRLQDPVATEAYAQTPPPPPPHLLATRRTRARPKMVARGHDRSDPHPTAANWQKSPCASRTLHRDVTPSRRWDVVLVSAAAAAQMWKHLSGA
ncbi:unnamed protein product [Gadus morhua 'NCC']